MAEIPNAPVRRLLTEGSHSCRVSASAVDLTSELVSNIVHLLGHTAGQKAMADGRKTIRDEDVSQSWMELTR